jgi:hypothetical protein
MKPQNSVRPRSHRKTRHISGDLRNRMPTRPTSQTHHQVRRVLRLVDMQDLDAVKRTDEHVTEPVFFTWVRKHHAHEVRAIRELVDRIYE